MEESMYCLKLLTDAFNTSESKMAELLKEADELTAILVACYKNAKEKR